MTTTTEKMEWIMVRGSMVLAERIYTSGRGDYIAYKYKGRIYRVDTPSAPAHEQAR
jgi:hypothetical protein